LASPVSLQRSASSIQARMAWLDSGVGGFLRSAATLYHCFGISVSGSRILVCFMKAFRLDKYHKGGCLKKFAALNHDTRQSLRHSVPPLQQQRLEKPAAPPSYSQQSLMERESCRIRNTNTSAVKKPPPGWHWPTKYCPGN